MYFIGRGNVIVILEYGKVRKGIGIGMGMDWHTTIISLYVRQLRLDSSTIHVLVDLILDIMFVIKFYLSSPH